MKRTIKRNPYSLGVSFLIATLIVFSVCILLTGFISSRSYLHEQREKVLLRTQSLSNVAVARRNELNMEAMLYHARNLEMFTHPDSAIVYCKRLADLRMSPFVFCIEYPPGHFPGRYAFAPYYDAKSVSFGNLADNAATRFYYKKDSAFVKFLSGNSFATWSLCAVPQVFGGECVRVTYPCYDENGEQLCLLNGLAAPETYVEFLSSMDMVAGENDCRILVDEKGNYLKTSSSNIQYSFDNDANFLDSIRILWGDDVYADVLRAVHGDTIFQSVHEVDDNSAFLCITARDELFKAMIWKVDIDTAPFFHTLKLEAAVILISLALLCFIGYLNSRRLSFLVRSEEKYKTEVGNAAMIQKSMLPSRLLNCPGIDMHALLLPSAAVGGDCYYYFEKEGRLYFCVGDVVDKGISAALFMSKVVSLFHNISQYHSEANRIAESINRELCTENEDVMFVTMFIAVLDIRTGMLNFCSAGHDGPLFWDGNAEHEPRILKMAHDIPLGVETDAVYRQGTLQLLPGSVLCLYTDGVTEAKNSVLDMFGEKGLLRAFSQHSDEESRQINEAVVSAIRSFADKHPQSDDITLLTLRIKTVDHTITLENKDSETVKLRDLFSLLRDYLCCTDKQLMDVRVGVDEAVTNCVKYAYGSGNGLITIHVTSNADTVIFTIRDEGVPFNLLEYQTPSRQGVKIEEMELGGLGIPLIKTTFDGIEYCRDGGANILKLKKTLNLL